MNNEQLFRVRIEAAKAYRQRGIQFIGSSADVYLLAQNAIAEADRMLREHSEGVRD